MQLTEQQENIIKAGAVSDYLRVNAFAGTGKTTVLKSFTEQHPDKSFLYLVFNKALADESQKKFGPNTLVKTIHALAYMYTREELKLGEVRGSYKVVEIKNLLNISNSDVAYMVTRLFDAFCCSAYKDLNATILKQLISEDIDLVLKMKKSKSTPSLPMIADGVLRMWNNMFNKRMEVNYNYYLKYFHIAIDKIKTRMNYDYILLDECQDTNAITLDIFNNLNGKKIIVGDKWQQIYGFRGTVNAMESFVKSTDQLYLSHTFRFNEKIADKANYILNTLLGEPESIVSQFPNKTGEIKTRCHITRTNSGVISLFAKYHEEGKIVKTVRDPDDIFKLPLAVYYFLCDKTRYKDQINKVGWLWNFRGRADLKEHAEEIGDIELLTSLKLVEEYWDQLISIHEQAKVNRRKKKIDVLLTTAHTCKGLEWDEVFIHDDFPDLLYKIAQIATDMEDFHKQIKEKSDIKSTSIQKTIEELNLFYVAITRGIYDVHVSLPNSNMFGMTHVQLDEIIEEHHATQNQRSKTR